MNEHEIQAAGPSAAEQADSPKGEPTIRLFELLVWLGEGKRLIGAATLVVALLSLGVSLLMTPVYTATATMLAPNTQSPGGSAAAMAALGSLSGLVGLSSSKSPDELYVALLKGDSVVRALADKYDLLERYHLKTYESLRRAIPSRIRVAADKKSGLISVEVDDADAQFAADLANAHLTEVTKLLGRLAVSEAQLRRVFFEKQLKDTKENLIKAEQDMQRVQEKSGVIALDKQSEALITNAAQLRALIAERDIQLKVLRTSATDQNPEVIRLNSELRAMRAELERMESSKAATNSGALDLPVGKIPEVAVDYIRARRELKLQEALLEGMIRQFEAAKLDEAKEGQSLQAVDIARPPDWKSKPSRALFVITWTLIALVLSSVYVIARRYNATMREWSPESALPWSTLRRAWRVRG